LRAHQAKKKKGDGACAFPTMHGRWAGLDERMVPAQRDVPGTRDATASEPPLSSLTGQPVHRVLRSRSIALTRISSWNRNLRTKLRNPMPVNPKHAHL
jgi:hypothetical protein